MRITQVERDFFVSRTGEKNLTNAKKLYFISALGAGSLKMGLLDLERQYLKKLITDSGGTPISHFVGDLLVEVCAIKGYPVSDLEQENRRTLYLNLP